MHFLQKGKILLPSSNLSFGMKQATIVLIFSLFYLPSLCAQSDNAQDLLETLNNTQENTQKVDLLLQLGETLLIVEPKESQRRAEEGLKLAEKLDYSKGITKAQILIGKAHLRQNHLVRAENNLEKVRLEAEQSGDIDILSDLYTHLAEVYQKRGKSVEMEIYRQKLRNLQQQQQLSKEDQQRIDVLRKQFTVQQDSASLARLDAYLAGEAADSALSEINRRDTLISKQLLKLEQLEKEAAQAEQERLQTELQLQQEQQRLALERQRLYWVLIGAAFLLLLGLGSWFFYQSKQAKKLAKREHLEVERLRVLTAGIAHEIKNPLNFVTNFAEGSNEIADEMEEVLTENQQSLDATQFSLLMELAEELKQNSVDIKKNGLRVNEIVRSMMDYAGGHKGERKKTVLNDLVEENIKRAYQAYRAQYNGFELNIEREYDASLSPVEIVPEDIGRVLLNIINNACDAMLQKQRESIENYTPTLTVMTESKNGEAIVRIRDNGPGIPHEVREQIFTPFFTTKPTGTGNTGLGLAISHEIVVQHHQGRLSVQSKPGEFTEFMIALPKKYKQDENSGSRR